MQSNKISAAEIWHKYEKDRSYKNSINLYDRVKQQENFFIGRQWEGVKAPDLPKPVLNVVKRVTNYLISVLVVDDVGIAFRQYNEGEQQTNPIYKLLPKEIDRVLELIKFKSCLRHLLRDAAVDGDVGYYARYNPGDGEEASSEKVTGCIEAEMVDNTRVVFGNPYTSEVEKQPFLIIAKTELTKELQKKYPEAADMIKADGDPENMIDDEAEDDITTVLTYLYKKDGTVHCILSVEGAILEADKDTGLHRYPFAFFSWEKVKNSYHGVGVVEEIIPNQIAINKLWAMAILFQQNNAFPHTFYDKTKFPNGWSNRVGAVTGVVGNPNEAYASSFKAHDMSAQVMQLVDKTIALTKEFMGANDAALGNVNPTNTSAIIQVQQAAAAPLELQRLAFYQFIEDFIRIVLDMMRNHYGVRPVTVDGEMLYVDFSQMPADDEIVVDIGAAAYWSETAQIQTMDNLFTAGILTDAEVYVDSIPPKNLPNKEKILQVVRENKAQQLALAQQQMMAGGLPNEEMLL